MKKKITTLLIFGLFVVGCSNDNNEVTENQIRNIEIEKSFADLNSKLEDYNNTYQFEVQTRKGFWKRFLWIVSADACGAAIGSVFGGAGALAGGILNSLFCGAIGPPKLSDNDPFYKTNITLVDGEIGKLHNLIIQDILKDNPMLLYSTIDSNKLSKIIQQKMKAYGYQISVSDNFRLVNKLEQVRPKTIPNSVEESILLYKRIAPEKANEIDIIYNFTLHAVQLNDEEALKKYSNGYINIIKESNIPYESAVIINSSLSVAANSSVLWVRE